MTKKVFLKLLDVSSYFALIGAAALIILFEFTGVLLAIRVAIILFGAAFLMFDVLTILRIFYLKKETKENDVLLVDKENTSLGWLIVRLCVGIILFVFTIVFLVSL